jgi:hypothetical protein
VALFTTTRQAPAPTCIDPVHADPHLFTVDAVHDGVTTRITVCVCPRPCCTVQVGMTGIRCICPACPADTCGAK